MPGCVWSRIHLGIGPAALVKPDARRTATRAKLRAMAPVDLAQVVAIEREWAPKPWSAETFAKELHVPFSQSRVAYQDHDRSGVCGYLVRWLVAREVHLLSLAVHSGVRRQGFGGLLLDDLLGETRAASVELIALEVESSNAVAIALYLSRGFKKTRSRKGYYGRGRDAQVMEWRS